MTDVFTRRLLSAARHAYQIKGAGAVVASPPPAVYAGSAFVQYATAPVAAAAGDAGQDAGFVATIAEGVLVSFRGTTPPLDPDHQQVLVDWVANTAARLVAAPAVPGQPPGFPGKLHEGFLKAFLRLWGKLQPQVKAMVDANPAPHPQVIYVTGHSKGGALATLAAWRLRQDHPNHQIRVRTFAAPRVGNRTFANQYNAAITDHLRYEFDDDLVPHLPMAAGVLGPLMFKAPIAALINMVDPGYAQVGTLRFIKDNYTVVNDSPGLAAQRLADLVVHAGSLAGARHIIECHYFDDPATHGYLKAQYP